MESFDAPETRVTSVMRISYTWVYGLIMLISVLTGFVVAHSFGGEVSGWMAFMALVAALFMGWHSDHQLIRLQATMDHDPGTGLGSRSWFEQRLQAECARSQRMLQPVALLVLDVIVVDRAQEDKVLAAIGEHLRISVRQEEVLARIEPHRLALIAVNCAHHQARQLKLRIEERLHGLRVLGPHGRFLDFTWKIHLITEESASSGYDFYVNSLRELDREKTSDPM